MDTGILYIIGAGILTPAQLSLETLDAIRECDEVWTNIPEAAQKAVPGARPGAIKSLKGLYLSQRPRIENYNAVTRHILERAASVSRLGYLTQGHPIVFDSVAKFLIDNAPDAGLQVRLLPAISCIDTILVDVLYDPARGLQIHEATTFVRDRILVDTRAALLLLQPSVFGSRMPRLTSLADAPNLSPLVDALRAFYADAHPVKFVRSASVSAGLSVMETTVGGIASVSPEVTLGCSLFVPALANRAGGGRG